MKEFLMGLYLKYGEREFTIMGGWGSISDALKQGFLSSLFDRIDPQGYYFFQLTPKAIEYLKHD